MNVKEVLDNVYAVTGISPTMLRRRNGSRSVSAARQLAMVELRRLGMSWNEIGKALNRDHSTVQHGCAKAQLRMQTDETYLQQHQSIQRLNDKKPREKIVAVVAEWKRDLPLVLQDTLTGQDMDVLVTRIARLL